MHSQLTVLGFLCSSYNVEGKQILQNVRPDTHSSASLPTELASEGMSDWQVRDDRVKFLLHVMVQKLNFLF